MGQVAPSKKRNSVSPKNTIEEHCISQKNLRDLQVGSGGLRLIYIGGFRHCNRPKGVIRAMALGGLGKFRMNTRQHKLLKKEDVRVRLEELTRSLLTCFDEGLVSDPPEPEYVS
jgi:hypothetical protein